MGVYKTVLFLKAQIRKKAFSRLGCLLGQQTLLKLNDPQEKVFFKILVLIRPHSEFQPQRLCHITYVTSFFNFYPLLGALNGWL